MRALHTIRKYWYMYTGALVLILGIVALYVINSRDPRLICTTHTAQEVQAVTVDPTGTMIAVGQRDGHVTLWKSNDCTHIRSLDTAPDRIMKLVFDVTGQYLYAGLLDGRVQQWEVSDRGSHIWQTPLSSLQSNLSYMDANGWLHLSGITCMILH